MTIEVPAALKALAETRAAEAGFENVSQFLAQLIVGEAAGAPSGLIIDSAAELEKLLAARAEGPFVEMDASDFEQIRKKLISSFTDTSVFPKGRP